MNKQNILVCGTVRNVGATFEASLNNLSRQLSTDFRTQFFFVESDSSDNTVDVLDKVRKINADFSYITLGNLAEEIPEREERIAFCRNKYLDYIRTEIPEEGRPTFIAIIDIDFVDRLKTTEPLGEILARTKYDVLFANTLGNYYDIHALRAPKWSNTDPVQLESKLLKMGLSPRKAIWAARFKKMRKIHSCQEPIPVRSAFGGLAIYRLQALQHCNYRARNDRGLIICEHVEFHKCISKNGFRMAIEPRILVPRSIEHSSLQYLRPWIHRSFFTAFGKRIRASIRK